MQNLLRRYFRHNKVIDSNTFAVIYDRFQKPIYNYVSSRITDPQVAEEVTQEVFIKAYRFRESYDETHEFSTWLWTIARNTVFDVLRKNRNTEAERIELDSDQNSLEEFPCGLGNAEILLERKDLRRLMKTIMKSLTKLQRRVLWMRIVQQRSYAEISKQLGLSLSAAKNLAHRAKLSMVEGLQEAPAFS